MPQFSRGFFTPGEIALSTEPDEMARNIADLSDRVRIAESRASALANLVDEQGILKPDLFSHWSPHTFTLFPLPSVGLVGSSAQNIENNAYTTLVYEAVSSLSSGLKFYSYSEGGISANTTAGTITVNGEPGNSLFLVTGFVQWESQSSGFREVRIVDSDGDFTPVAIHAAFAGSGVVQSFGVIRQMFSSISVLSLNGYQNRGSSMAVTRRAFQVTRIR